jgi:hypothetical protein
VAILGLISLAAVTSIKDPQGVDLNVRDSDAG